MAKQMIVHPDKRSERWINLSDHILIAGTTGSGKSTVINSMIYSVLCDSPDEHSMVLIDPKMVEFDPYRNTPHCAMYAETLEEIRDTLRTCLNLVKIRNNELKGTGKKEYEGTKLHIFIDELMVIMLSKEKIANEIRTYLAQLLAIARSANVQIIMATQSPLSSVIPTIIKANCGIIVGLRTRNAQDSRNILDESGCETLPKIGYALIKDAYTPETYKVQINKISDEDINALIKYREEGN